MVIGPSRCKSRKIDRSPIFQGQSIPAKAELLVVRTRIIKTTQIHPGLQPAFGQHQFVAVDRRAFQEFISVIQIVIIDQMVGDQLVIGSDVVAQLGVVVKNPIVVGQGVIRFRTYQLGAGYKTGVIGKIIQGDLAVVYLKIGNGVFLKLRLPHG